MSEKWHGSCRSKLNLMKKMALTFTIITLFFSHLTAPPNERIAIVRHAPICPYERIINTVVTVESGGNTFAYNAKERAVGAFQIRQVRLTEYNRLTGERLKLTDCYDYETSKRIFIYYAVQFRYDDYKAISIDWNKSKTLKYWNKVKQRL